MTGCSRVSTRREVFDLGRPGIIEECRGDDRSSQAEPVDPEPVERPRRVFPVARAANETEVVAVLV